MRAFIGVGSNLGDRWGNLALAARSLRESGAAAVIRASSVWDTPPMGPPQPRYLNAVLEVETVLTPRALLALLQRIEGAAHRRRGGARWAARTLDLDLLLYEELTLREPGLTVPHAGIAARRFVLVPLAELAPARVVPGLGRSVETLLADAPEGFMERAGLYPL